MAGPRARFPAGRRGRDGRADVPLPDYVASNSVERVNIVRLSHGNDHWAGGTVLNVKWLGVNIACNRAVKICVPRQISGVRRRECGIDVKTVTRIVVVMLGDVD